MPQRHPDIDDASSPSMPRSWAIAPTESLRTAYSQGRHAPFPSATPSAKLLGAWARDYNVVNSIDQSVLKAQLEEIAGQVNEPAVAATITGSTRRRLYLRRGQDGRVVDVTT